MEAFVRYIAVNAADPERTAEFYRRWFGLSELGRSPSGDISLTDGWLNFTLLKIRPGKGMAQGFSHYGIAVSDLATLKSRLAEIAPGTVLEPDVGGLHHGELQLKDLSGMKIAISAQNFGVVDRPFAPARFRHVSASIPTTEALFAFFRDIFGLRELSSGLDKRAAGTDKFPFLFMGDGEVNLSLLPLDQLITRPDRRNIDVSHRETGWFGHIGFVVPNVDAMAAELASHAAGERMVDCRIYDPEDNAIDLSQYKGFEVDFNKWIRAA
jgi:catechol 2,3-dioxygenase-like lactoylglutathione lyase family enzyme